MSGSATLCKTTNSPSANGLGKLRRCLESSLPRWTLPPSSASDSDSEADSESSDAFSSICSNSSSETCGFPAAARLALKR